MRATITRLRCCCSPPAQYSSSFPALSTHLRALNNVNLANPARHGSLASPLSSSPSPSRSRSIATLSKHSKSDLEKPFRAVFHAYCLPHPAKQEVGGEDSYFACHESGTCGVADGVGGWQDMGVNPAAFSRALMRYSHAALSEMQQSGSGSGSGRGSDGSGADILVQALHESLKKTIDTGVLGSSTAALASFDAAQRTVNCLNLGDSGVLMFRPSLRLTLGQSQMLYPRVIYRSERHVTGFNCPLQLSHLDDPDEVFAMPDMVSVQAKVDDLVILCTDGVYDNLFDEQVQHIVSSYYVAKYKKKPMKAEFDLDAEDPDKSPSPLPISSTDEAKLAREIAHQAQKVALKKTVTTPFEVSAREEGIKSVRGGKLDDITVVVCSFQHNDNDEDLENEPTTQRVPLQTNFNDAV